MLAVDLWLGARRVMDTIGPSRDTWVEDLPHKTLSLLMCASRGNPRLLVQSCFLYFHILRTMVSGGRHYAVAVVP